MADDKTQKIKDLRERTGVGMSQCKKVLEECSWDIDSAIKKLRELGMASAVKKEGREAKEGLIAVAETADRTAFVEVNAETDFVVQNERFQEFQTNIAEEAARTNPTSLEAFLAQPFSKDPGMTIDAYRASIVQAIGENIQIRRLFLIAKKPENSLAIYSHHGGKIAVAVELEGASGEEGLARDIAMHAAATAPEFLRPDAVPGEVVEREREIGRKQVEGKPAHVIDKIVEGKVNAYFDQVCLCRQKFIKDDSMTIDQLVERRAKELGHPLRVAYFLRLQVGEGAVQ